MCLFDFSLPIGWNELGVIATVAAVVVALWSNRKATKQLKSALEMQEQSKNVGLMDRRIALAENIQKGETVSEIDLRVSFNNEIFCSYEKWRNLLDEENKASKDQAAFYMLTSKYKHNNLPDSITGAIGSRKPETYNITEINERLNTAKSNVVKQHTELLQLIENYIAKSIRPVSRV